MNTKILSTEIASYLSVIFNFLSNGEKNDGHILHYIVQFHFFSVGFCKFQYFFSDCYSSEETTNFEKKQPWTHWTVFCEEQIHIIYLVRVLIYVIILYLRNIMKCETSLSHPKEENNRKKDGYSNCRIYLYFRMSDESCKKWKQSCEINSLIYSIKSIIQMFLSENIQQS